MPRYFFHVHDDEDTPDDTGTELPDRNAMRTEAIRLAGEILRDLSGKLAGEQWSMMVRDEAGLQVMALEFSAVEH